MIAGYTGGAPGAPTYDQWTFVAPNVSGTSFLNPSNASSQVVRFPPTAGPGNSTFVQGVRVRVTDPQGNQSLETATATLNVIDNTS